jgi:hypothetical protein
LSRELYGVLRFATDRLKAVQVNFKDGTWRVFQGQDLTPAIEVLSKRFNVHLTTQS